MRKTPVILTIALFSALPWLQSCTEQATEKVVKNVQYVSGTDEVTYLKIGKEIADTLGTTLKVNLTKAMQETGPVGAVRFCNASAMELTSSFSQKYNTDVKRVSDRNRNELNAPNEMEAMVFADFQAMLEKGEAPSPKVAIDTEGRKNFYAPIITGAPCLTCHGPSDSMVPELTAVIDSLYPNDQAKGYGLGELRGMWSIKFKNS